MTCLLVRIKTNSSFIEFIVSPIVGFCNCSLFGCTLLCFHSSFIWGRFALFVFLVSRSCCVTLPRGATGLSAVCVRGIS